MISDRYDSGNFIGKRIAIYNKVAPTSQRARILPWQLRRERAVDRMSEMDKLWLNGRVSKMEILRANTREKRDSHLKRKLIIYMS